LGKKSGFGSSVYGYGVYCVGTDPFSSIDYNIYYLQNHNINWVGYLSGNKNFSNWKIAVSDDGNTLNQDPDFISSADLHLGAGDGQNGVAIGGITTDIDGDTRTSNHRGADEESTLCGNYYVGISDPAYDYDKIEDVVTDLNEKGISCSCIFYLMDETYSESPQTLNTISGAASDKTVTIKPGTDVTPTVTFTATADDQAGLKLYATDYFILDGSSTNKGTDRDLSIIMSGVIDYETRAIEFANSGADGASYDTIRYVNIYGDSRESGNYGIYMTGEDNDYNVIIGNSIEREYYGIFLDSEESTNYNDDNKITENIIGSSTASYYINYSGIYYKYQDDILIQGNEIFNIYSDNETGICANAIYSDYSTNVSILKNKIHDIAYTGSNSFGAKGIYVYTDQNSPVILIQNNFIWHIAGISDVCGIYIQGSSGKPTGGLNIYHNSIYLTKDTQYSPDLAGTRTAALIIGSEGTGINVVNNLFRNSLGEADGAPVYTSRGSAVHVAKTTNPFGTINNNVYYTSEFDENNVGSSTVSSYTSYTTLAAWQGFTGDDANSYNQDPKFFSEINLHLDVPASYVNGTNLSVSDDIDGDTRANPPDIGADEDAALCGNYYVGVSQSYDYQDIEEVVTDLNNKGIDCSCIFYLMDETYSEDELSLNAITGASSTKTVTIKPYTGITPEITFTCDADNDAGFKLNGTDYFIWDGSNLLDGTSRDLSLTNAGNFDTRVIEFANPGTGASNNIIKNCIVLGYQNNASGNYCIYINGENHDDNTIQNCKLARAYQAIYIYGNSSNYNDDNQIIDNEIGAGSGDSFSKSLSDNMIKATGIYVVYQNSLLVKSNEIYNIIGTINQETGISIRLSTSVVISYNDIHDILYTWTGGNSGAVGIKLSLNGANPDITVKNNFIRHISGDGWSGMDLTPYGIEVDYSGSGTQPSTASCVKIYHNSIYLTLDNDNGLDNTGSCACVGIHPEISGVNMRNNIFRNSLGPNAADGYYYAVMVGSASSPFTDIDNNIYYLTDEGGNQHVGCSNGIFVYGSRTNYDNLSDWQAFTSDDASSHQIQPQYLSIVDLHLQPEIATNGINITSISDDIDNESRKNPPDIGADEQESSLPIKYCYAGAECQDGIVLIEWGTSYEFNNKIFCIQQSTDGENFVTIGEVEPNKSIGLNEYLYIDTEPSDNINYYRLKQIDYNGNFSYSNIFHSNCSGDNDNSGSDLFSVYGNLNNDGNIKVVYSSEIDFEGEISVYNMMGQSLATKRHDFIKGSNVISLNYRHLSPGLYVLELSNEEIKRSKKIIIK